MSEQKYCWGPIILAVVAFVAENKWTEVRWNGSKYIPAKTHIRKIF
jgi:hypothetical protein